MQRYILTYSKREKIERTCVESAKSSAVGFLISVSDLESEKGNSVQFTHTHREQNNFEYRFVHKMLGTPKKEE